MRRLPPPSRLSRRRAPTESRHHARAELAAPRSPGAVALSRTARPAGWRDIAVRYKQTSIGVAWAILQPFLTMVVFTFVFGKFADFPSKGLPYPIFSYSALLPWTYFAGAVGLAELSLVSNRGLVTKVYFPRILLPLAGVTVPARRLPARVRRPLRDDGVVPGVAERWRIVLAPFFSLWRSDRARRRAVPLGCERPLSRRPVRDPVPHAIWMFFSGVVYALNGPEEWQQWLLALNPMTAVIGGFQWGVIGTGSPDLGQDSRQRCAATVVFVVVGLWYFRRSEPRFADTI